ncbi:hypothetical protein AMI01nite_30150 [Aneurinibacillus migulanus]|nr:hypothetical protein AMI01nite_30150 [Aneurinibacillus migulanus]
MKTKKISTALDVVLLIVFLAWLSDLNLSEMTLIKWVGVGAIALWFALGIWKVVLWRAR